MPRNEYELCELFEVLLFGRIDKFSSETSVKKINKLSLADNEIERLYNSGIINRIFRKWFQINWLYDGDSAHFTGATPRQELDRLYPNLANGGDYMAVELENRNGGWKVVPHYYAKKYLLQNGGVFEFGRKQSAAGGKTFAAPQFDCEFSIFSNMVELFGGKFAGKPLGAFITMAAGNIIINTGMDLTEDKFLDLTNNFYECLIWILKHHPKGEDNFLEIDKVFFNIWDILRSSDKNLLSFAELAGTDKFDRKRAGKDLDYRKSQEVLFKLGTAFDRYFLFPLDRYFGMAEIVWTEKEIFMADLGMTNELLKNDFKIKQVGEKQDLLKIGSLMDDMRYFWFSPPTCFRLLDSFFEEFDQ